jgi:hypothetical protein
VARCCQLHGFIAAYGAVGNIVRVNECNGDFSPVINVPSDADEPLSVTENNVGTLLTELHHDTALHLHRLTVDDVWLELPLLNRVRSNISEKGVT